MNTTIGQIDTSDIERHCKMVHDFRFEATNERKSIYEISPFNHYCLIHKQNGEVIKLVYAQNSLVLILKHIN